MTTSSNTNNNTSSTVEYSTNTNSSGDFNWSLNSDKCKYSQSENALLTNYTYNKTIVDIQQSHNNNNINVSTLTKDYNFKVDLKIPKIGVMLVGMGGNNGTTFLASLLANKNNLTFNNKDGPYNIKERGGFLGSMTQSSTLYLGKNQQTNEDVYVPFNSILPMCNPNDLIISGWDISGENMFKAMQRAKVLEYDLQEKLKPLMESYTPLKSIYYPDFIAMNQLDRADNCINYTTKGTNHDAYSIKNKWNDLLTIRQNIKDFKNDNKLDKVIILWTATTEKFAEVIPGINDTFENLLNSIKANHKEIAPSTIFATASILENCPYINGSPQNTFVPGLIDLAERENVLIAGDDFKTGQTKLKSVLAQFLIDAGIKPISIASYNHLGNNDGLNLSSSLQFKSKEITKSNVIDDMIKSNQILYPQSDKMKKKNKDVDHCIVIKYMESIGDSKVAMDEYYNELMLGGHNRISIHNVCEDSLLASPIILDLIIMCEFCSRITYIESGNQQGDGNYQQFYPVLSLLSYWLKAPLTRPGYEPINGLNKQRMALDNFMRLLIGLPPIDELRFEERLM
ncbi:inositol-3-phosphate synthase INO1 NDAI_0B00120 [Naumovozyma dairenensis CBS 421]|uniref:Inositol-3-phosphate synthase n=1 Tax=Naumovozyma dairenensis (strain ATCC 10597 / BCRC 20456 / CBS 421 / NBRC 0211 / NRRL Y-12639) TaxID=1071378 RepID=G0W5I5_NAUDC|nr:hypothetical protein NDAI_0B00120 [Naumovozyma dairenensis CBS 421]CCD23046.1 hypothetical protein NDAI_0B00120 [Naumovozyma dairenensis CBS 421]